MSGEARIIGEQAAVVAQRAGNLDRLHRLVLQQGCLWIVREGGSAAQGIADERSGHDIGPGFPLHCGKAADMVEMFVGGKDPADPPGIESQRAHIGQHVRHGFPRAGIDQHQPGAGIDQHHGDPAGADVPGLTMNMGGRGRIGPAIAGAAGLGDILARSGAIGQRGRGRAE